MAVSPLTRAIETAVGCFGDHGALKRAAAAGDGNGNGGGGNGNGGNGGSSGENGNASGAAVGDGEGLLMVELSEVAGRRAAHAAVALGDAPPFLCMELCREHLGVSCRRKLARLLVGQHPVQKAARIVGSACTLNASPTFMCARCSMWQVAAVP